MTEEKKDDLNEQQTFLNDHEKLLKSIHKKPDTPDEQPEVAEEVPAPDTDVEEPAVGDAAPAPESPEPIEEPAAKEEPIVEEKPAPVTEPENPEDVPAPETDTEEVPVADETAAAESGERIEESIEEEAAPVTEQEPASEPEAVVEAPVEEPREPVRKKKAKTVPQPRQHSPQHEALLKQQALEQKEVKEVLVFFRKYAKPAAIVIALACVIVLADKFFKSQRFKKEAAADTALMNARGAEDLQDIVNDYASTPTGPLALMELAREKFNAGQFDEAEELYTKFTKKHSDHELATQAELNLITCKEAKGQLGEAHLLYGQFAKKHEEAYLAPSAMIGQARCLEALDQLDEAQIAYEDIIVNFPETAWSRIAEANLKVILSKKQ
jgi:predicted negative regulator of RcsB-dependent stress response